MTNGPVLSQREPLQSGEALNPCAGQIGQIVFRPLASNTHIGITNFPSPQIHNPILSGTNPSVKGLLKIVAAHLHEMLPLLLALAATLRLIGALEKIGGLGGIFGLQVFRCRWMRWKIEQDISRNNCQPRLSAREFFADGNQLTKKHLCLTFGVLAFDSHLEEVQLIGNVAVRVHEHADTRCERSEHFVQPLINSGV